MAKSLPKRSAASHPQDLARISDGAREARPAGPPRRAAAAEPGAASARSQELRDRQAEVAELHRRELDETNRGVVALYAELDENAKDLKRISELKSRFLSNMSHEFRSPLNTILSLSGFLLDGATAS